MGVKNAIKVEVNYNYPRQILLKVGIIGYIMSLTVVVVENYHDNDNE